MPSAGHEIERRVERFIKAERLLAPGDSLLLAVSGGADSLALLAVMARLAPRLDIRLRVVYVDHQLRPNEQIAADIETVTDAATAFHLPLSISRVPPRHRQDGRSPEQYAREVRYRALAEEAARHHAARVATGHTRTDQAETVLLRLVRGAGLHGLGAMAPDAPWPVGDATHHPRLVRPLLCLSRQATEAYCAAHALRPRHDNDNDNPRYLRNRVRQSILAPLRELNPAIDVVLARLAEEVRGQQSEQAETAAVETHWQDGRIALDRAALRRLPSTRRVPLLRAALAAVLPNQPAPSRAHLEALEHLASLDRAAEHHLPDGLQAWTDGDRLLLGRPAERVAALPDAVVAVPGNLHIGPWRISADFDRSDELSAGDWCVLLRADLANGLTVGPRRPGERIDVGSGHRRLQDLLVDSKTPRRLRDTIPVFRVGSRVVWVAGVRVAEWARYRGTGRAMRLRVQRLGDGDSTTAAVAPATR